jgi:hypothetical protein
VNLREARIAMDYATGKDVESIAAHEQLSTQRIYQLLNKVCRHLWGYGTMSMLRHYPEVAAARLRINRAPNIYDRTTPEGHYWEVMNEPKIFERWGFRE